MRRLGEGTQKVKAMDGERGEGRAEGEWEGRGKGKAKAKAKAQRKMKGTGKWMGREGKRKTDRKGKRR